MKAEYVDHMGTDLTVVNSARVSFSKESKLEVLHVGHGPSSKVIEVLSQADTKLINYLSKHGHWTPFSHPMVTMRETVPIFVARQRFKHMIGFAYNEVSRRYVDDTPEFFTPDVWRSRPEGSVKQGSGNQDISHFIEDGDWDKIAIDQVYREHLENSRDLYNKLIKDGVAPEQARMVLPQSMLTSYYVTGSLAAWARAYKQRIDSHAQVEIQELAKQWGDIIEPLYPVSWKSLTSGG
jgi:thymidylate synthase (FAD)